MENYIQTLNADLARMEELMKSLLVTPSDFETFLSLYLLYKEYQHTNTLIDYAEGVLKSGEGIDQLPAEAENVDMIWALKRSEQNVGEGGEVEKPLFTRGWEV